MCEPKCQTIQCTIHTKREATTNYFTFDVKFLFEDFFERQRAVRSLSRHPGSILPLHNKCRLRLSLYHQQRSRRNICSSVFILIAFIGEIIGPKRAGRERAAIRVNSRFHWSSLIRCRRNGWRSFMARQPRDASDDGLAVARRLRDSRQKQPRKRAVFVAFACQNWLLRLTTVRGL